MVRKVNHLPSLDARVLQADMARTVFVFDGKVKPTQEMLEAAPPNTVLYKSENGYISKRIFP